MKRLMLVGGACLIAATVVQAVHLSISEAANRNVTVDDSFFQDSVSSNSTTTISVGDTVMWSWAGSLDHSVTADAGAFDSNPPNSFQSSGTYQFTFNSPGTYTYYCRVHSAPGLSLMNGTVIVQQAATNTPLAATNTPVPATSTPGPSNTPDPDNTATATRTPVPSGTTNTAVAAIVTPAPASSGGAAAGAGSGAQLPSTGAGGGSASSDLSALAMALALAGAATVGAAGALRLARIIR